MQVPEKIQSGWEYLRTAATVGRGIVTAAAFVGCALFLRQLLVQEEDLYPAFLKGLGAWFAVMVVLGAARELWANKRVQNATGPAGTGGLGFDDETKATQTAVDAVNERVDAQMKDLNKRLYDLETAVFKPAEPGDDKQE